MTKDRLTDLQAIHGETDDHLSDDVVVEFHRDANDNTFMDEFSKQVGEIRLMIEKISSDVAKLKTEQSSLLSAGHVNNEIRKTVERLTSDIRITAKTVKDKLKDISQDVQLQERCKKSSVELRIQKAQLTGLSRQFVEVMKDYNTSQLDHRERYKARIRRQLEIAGRNTTNEELEAMLYGDKDNPSIFTQEIIFETEQAKEALADIKSRHSDIIRLERSINELHDLFFDMEMLVESQGKRLDSIEYNVEQAHDYVTNGTDQIKIARRYKRNYCRRKTMLIICLVIVLGVIGLIVGLSLGLTQS